jgi:hypothetical protein
MRLKATIIIAYEADPKRYGTNDPLEMAKIDEANLLSDLVSSGLAEDCDISSVFVEPINKPSAVGALEDEQ